MDEKLLRRLQFGAVGTAILAYFLPWASVLSPLGSLDIRGLYIDYAWVVLLLAVIHLALQFALKEWPRLGLADDSRKYPTIAWKIIPFVLLAFFLWYGLSFAFAGTGIAHVLGGSLDLEGASGVRAGLDYGYWIGAAGVAVLVVTSGIIVGSLRRFTAFAIFVCIGAAGLAFVTSRHGKSAPPNAALATTTTSPEATAPAQPQSFDSSPYVRLASISGKILEENDEIERFHNQIVISPVFHNVGTRTVVGMRGHIAVVDGFGKPVYSFGFRFDDKLLPGKDSSGGYNFDENQFEDDDPYHRMFPLVQAGTAKYSVQIDSIAFDGGSVLPSQ